MIKLKKKCKEDLLWKNKISKFYIYFNDCCFNGLLYDSLQRSNKFNRRANNSNVVCNYILVYCKNFIMAYPLQIFFVEPLVRNIFRIIFKKQLQQV